MGNDTKVCPYCGETIKTQAKKCRHCGEWLEDNKTISCTKVESKVPDQPTLIVQKENEKTSSKRNQSTNNKKPRIILCAILAVALIILGFVIFSPSESDNGFKMNMLDELSYARVSSNKASIIGKYTSSDVIISDLNNNVWDSPNGIRVSTPTKNKFDEWTSWLSDFRYNNIIDNDSIAVYSYRESCFGNDLIIVWKNAPKGIYAIDFIGENPSDFSYLIKKRNDKQQLLEFANHIPIPYDGIMLSTKGDKIIVLPKEESNKKLSLLSIVPSDTILRPFYPPNGKNWNIVYCWWGERVSKVIYQNPDADKSAQMEFWSYDCVDDEWDNKLEAPALSIKREPDSKITVTWEIAKGKNVSVTDYTYISKFEIPKEQEVESPKASYNLSLANLMEICGKKRRDAISYLKSQGLVAKDGGTDYNGQPIYYFETPTGTISINNEGMPHMGTGAVEFMTESKAVYNSWIKELKNAGYSTDGNGLWYGDNAHYFTFGLYDTTDMAEDDDYAGCYTLCVKAFPMVYDQRAGHYVEFEYKY